ncbi:MAG: DUF4290 domain-containing protein [Bacteroidaceae bacterium]|nr:DUF4290 domain-containing protein [Bacteroidaceae bacterium]
MEYNTNRERLTLPEYGRCIQQMVDHAKTLEDKAERLRCATTIISLMANMHEQHGAPEDFRQKLWNHLAAMANYELDIDYPVEIERHDKDGDKRERVPYPQKRIQKRHYGYIIETLTRKMAEIEDEEKRNALAGFMANQMKRCLAKWNRDAMDEEKIIEDIAAYTDNLVKLDPDTFKFISDAEALNGNQSNGNKKKKKK